MENASKALIMAGSILMSLIIIGLLVFMVGNLSQVEQTKTDSEEIKKLVDYNKKFEQFNKTIYGSELLSLANLQEDYNLKQSSENGYEPINITVTINNPISGTTYFRVGRNIDISTITRDKNNIENTIRQYEETSVARRNGKLYRNRVVKYYAQLRYMEIANIFGISYSTYDDYEVEEILRNNGSTRNLMRDIDSYRNIKSVYTEFKNKRFRCNRIEYSEQTTRVRTMVFTEI